MKKFVFLMFMTFLFSSCAWFMEVFDEEINEDPWYKISFENDPDKKIYKVGEIVNFIIDGELDFKKKNHYVLDIGVSQNGISYEESCKKIRFVNEDGTFHFEFYEIDCISFPRTEDNSYKLYVTIPVKLMEPTESDICFRLFESSNVTIGACSFSIVP